MKYHCEHCGREGYCHGAVAPRCPYCRKFDGLIPLHDWEWFVKEERMLGLKKKRQRQLFTASVIIAALCAAILYVSYIAWSYETAITPAPKVEKKLTLPQRCAVFLDTAPRKWNPVTETYPPNIKWRECMGVG